MSDFKLSNGWKKCCADCKHVRRTEGYDIIAECGLTGMCVNVKVYDVCKWFEPTNELIFAECTCGLDSLIAEAEQKPVCKTCGGSGKIQSQSFNNEIEDTEQQINKHIELYFATAEESPTKDSHLRQIMVFIDRQAATITDLENSYIWACQGNMDKVKIINNLKAENETQREEISMQATEIKRLEEAISKMCDGISRILNKCKEDTDGYICVNASDLYKVISCGEEQVADDDSEGMGWIYNRIQELKGNK